MAARLFIRSIGPLTIGAGLATSSLFLSPFLRSRPLLCDTPSQPFSERISQKNHTTQSTLYKNRRQIRQITSGSLTGLLAGLAVSAFSKPLALLIGLLVAGIYSLEASGLHIIPYQRIQRYFKEYDIAGAFQENMSFKLAFGVTWSLAAFGSLS